MTNIPVHWHPKQPASEPIIAQLIRESHMELPTVYLDLLRVSNGGYAEFSVSPWTIDFWPAQDLLRLNREYGMDQQAPGYLAIGSNLGEEMIAFNKREGMRTGVYMLPWHAPDTEDILKVAPDFESLVRAMTGDENS